MNAYAADYTEWSNSGVLPTDAGSYYLTTDITLDSTWCVPSGATNLRLNGHGIIYTGSNNARVITVGNGAELNLYDSDTTTKHYVMLDAIGRGTSVSDTTTDGAIEVTGGYITGGTITISEGYGGGVYVSDGGSFTMYGGTIEGNSAMKSCGGLYVYKPVNLSGSVRIINNTADGGMSNLYVTSGGKINIIGKLDDTSSIGVLMKSP